MISIDHEQARFFGGRNKGVSRVIRLSATVHNEHEDSESFMETLSVLDWPSVEKTVSGIAGAKNHLVIARAVKFDRNRHCPIDIEHARPPVDEAKQRCRGLVPRRVQSRSENTGFFRRADECQPSCLAIDLTIDSTETCSSGRREALTAFGRPGGHEASHCIPGANDTPEVIRVLDHQLNRLVPKIFAHLVTIGILAAEEILSRPARSSIFCRWTKVPTVFATKGREHQR
jgi:hypothetical protein